MYALFGVLFLVGTVAYWVVTHAFTGKSEIYEDSGESEQVRV